jgi:hypothetical protein
MPDPSSVIWRLRGETARDVECVIVSTPSRAVILTLVRDYETMLRETYPDNESAAFRANELRANLVKRGWNLTAV